MSCYTAILIFFTSMILHAGHGATFTYDGIGYLSDEENAWMLGRGTNKPRCIPIPSNLSLCRNIGYNEMRLPNLLQHDTLEEVIQQSKSWTSLIRVHCHPDTQIFLCSLFSPVCLADRTIYPCRELCENVKAGCEKKMNHYGYLWPDMVKCDKFPFQNESDMCIQPVHNGTMEGNRCEPCNQPSSREAIVDNMCRSEFVTRVKIRRIREKRNSKILLLKKKKKFYKSGSLSRRDKRKLNLVIQNTAECECQINYNESNGKYLVMGNRTADNKMKLTYIARFRPKDPEFRKALRQIKTFNCSTIVDLIEQPPGSTTHTNGNNTGNGRGNGGRRRGGSGRPNRGNKRRQGGRKRKNRRRKNRQRTSNRRRVTSAVSSETPSETT